MSKKALYLEQLKLLATKTKADITAVDSKVDTLSGKVDQLVAEGGEPNVITAVKVNGAAQAIDGKAVDIAVPVKVSDLTNDSKFQTDEQVAAAVAAADHLKRKKVASKDDIDLTADDADQYIYMVPKSGGKNGDKYDEYMVLDGTVEPVGDWAVDLSGYQQKETGKGLSTNDYTTDEKAKLSGVAAGATKVEAGTTDGTIKINGAETAVVEYATDAEVTAMLTEVFGA